MKQGDTIKFTIADRDVVDLSKPHQLTFAQRQKKGNHAALFGSVKPVVVTMLEVSDAHTTKKVLEKTDQVVHRLLFNAGENANKEMLAQEM